MAVEFENKIPEWENEGTEPTSELKKTGFTAGYKPPAAYFNWFWSLVSKCIKEIQTKISELQTGLSDMTVITVDKVIPASAWEDGVYVWSNENITTADQIVELTPRQNITVEQLNALQYANIVGISQSVGSITLKAYGEVPTIDIPVTFIIRGVV